MGWPSIASKNKRTGEVTYNCGSVTNPSQVHGMFEALRHDFSRERQLMAQCASKVQVLVWHQDSAHRVEWVPSSLVHNERIAESRDRDSGCHYSPVMFGGAP